MSGAERKKEEKGVKIEEVAKDTGELIGKGIRKAWHVTKSFGKGVVVSLEKKADDDKDVVPLTCPHCGASLPSDSNFCASCGKKI